MRRLQPKSMASRPGRGAATAGHSLLLLAGEVVVTLVLLPLLPPLLLLPLLPLLPASLLPS